jgi:hypothetical protein
MGIFLVSRSISSVASSLALAGETMIVVANPVTPVNSNSRRVGPVILLSSGMPALHLHSTGA